MLSFENYLNERIVSADIIDAFINWLDDKSIFYQKIYVDFSTRVLFGIHKNFYAKYDMNDNLTFYYMKTNDDNEYIDTVIKYDDIVWQNVINKCKDYDKV